MARTPYNDPETEKLYQDSSVDQRNTQMAENTASGMPMVTKIGGAANPDKFLENVLRGAKQSGAFRALGTKDNVIKFPERKK